MDENVVQQVDAELRELADEIALMAQEMGKFAPAGAEARAPFGFAWRRLKSVQRLLTDAEASVSGFSLTLGIGVSVTINFSLRDSDG